MLFGFRGFAVGFWLGVGGGGGVNNVLFAVSLLGALRLFGGGVC